MSRSSKDLQLSKRRIKEAITVLQLELTALEAEERALVSIALTDRFFWDHVAAELEGREVGLSSADLRSLVDDRIPPKNFRTFLSRLKSKGFLVAVGSGKVKNWKLSSAGEKTYFAKKARS